MWAILAGLGRLLWPAIGAVAPAVSPKLTVVALILLLTVIAISAPAGAVWLHMRGVRDQAVAARDLHWTSELAKANETHAKTLAAARQAAKAVVATPADRAERLLICQQSPTCREERRR
jgi:hypothetical protein